MIRAAGVIYYHNDSILLLRRASGDMAGTWGLPGGKIEEGETPAQAARRESREEIGTEPSERTMVKVDHTNDGSLEFTTFKAWVNGKFTPILNEEHSEHQWASLDSLPENLHPGVAATLRKLKEGVFTLDSARQYDANGWYEIKGNPLSKVGVFPYSGRSIGAPDKDKMYLVYRPEEELANPATIESFKLLPWIDDHTMLGAREDGLTPAERKGVEGVIGEEVFYDNGILRGNIKIFSESLRTLIESGKKELSAGYRCTYEMVSGEWNGQRYDAIQRNIRGNHVALVKEGRMGRDVAVLDHLTITFDEKELAKMADNELEGRVKKAEDAIARLTAKDEAEEKAKKEAEDKAAKDAEEEEKKKEAEDTATTKPSTKPGVDEEEEKKEEGMDAAEVKKLVARIDTLEKGGIKATLAEVSARNKLAADLSNFVGSFDHAEMTTDEVAKYGVEKLNIQCPAGQERVFLDGFIAGKKTAAPSVGFSMDAKPSAKFSESLDKRK